MFNLKKLTWPFISGLIFGAGLIVSVLIVHAITYVAPNQCQNPNDAGCDITPSGTKAGNVKFDIGDVQGDINVTGKGSFGNGVNLNSNLSNGTALRMYNSWTTPDAEIRGNNDTWLFGYLGAAGAEDISIGTQDNTGSRTITLATGGTAKMKILANGYVGIGTMAPASKLSVVDGSQQINMATGGNTSGYSLNIGVNDDGVNFNNDSRIRGYNFSNANGSLLTMSQTGDANFPSGQLTVSGGAKLGSLSIGNAPVTYPYESIMAPGALNLRLYSQGGNIVFYAGGGNVQVGQWTIGGLTIDSGGLAVNSGPLSVSGAITSGGINVCLQNGTGCPAAASPTWSNITGKPSCGAGEYLGGSGLTCSTPSAGSVPWSSITGIPAGFSDGVDNTGITSETDPNVPAWAKAGSPPAETDPSVKSWAKTDSPTIPGNVTLNGLVNTIGASSVLDIGLEYKSYSQGGSGGCADIAVDCSSGKKVLGGGCYGGGDIVYGEGPKADLSGWTCNPVDADACRASVVYAVCARVK